MEIISQLNNHINIESNNYSKLQELKKPKKNINFVIEIQNINFNYNYIKKKIEENKKNKINKIIQELKLVYPFLADDILINLYNKSISIYQSNLQSNL